MYKRQPVQEPVLVGNVAENVVREWPRVRLQESRVQCVKNCPYNIWQLIIFPWGEASSIGQPIFLPYKQFPTFEVRISCHQDES